MLLVTTINTNALPCSPGFQSIGIAAAPKFKEHAIGGFQPSATPASPHKVPASTAQASATRGARTTKTGAAEQASAGNGASRVSAISTVEDSASNSGAAMWDEDLELDDLIGDD